MPVDSRHHTGSPSTFEQSASRSVHWRCGRTSKGETTTSPKGRMLQGAITLGNIDAKADHSHLQYKELERSIPLPINHCGQELSTSGGSTCLNVRSNGGWQFSLHDIQPKNDCRHCSFHVAGTRWRKRTGCTRFPGPNLLQRSDLIYSP